MTFQFLEKILVKSKTLDVFRSKNQLKMINFRFRKNFRCLLNREICDFS